MTTARYREVRPCEPGYCYQARAVGAEGTCFGECVAARYLGGRRIEDVEPVAEPVEVQCGGPDCHHPDLSRGRAHPSYRCIGRCMADAPPDAAADIELAPESWAQLTCPEWTI